MSTVNKVMTSEYYFEYKIEKVFGNNEAIVCPKIYFERNYSFQHLPYSMFAVPYEWLNKQRVLSEISGNKDLASVRAALDKLPYDRVKMVYNINGTDCSPLADEKSKDYEKAEIKDDISFEKFYQSGCRIFIENGNSSEYSGAGVLEMSRREEVVARFYFVVNFTLRKKISYTLQVSKNKINIEFQCKDCPVGVPVAIVYNKDRLPCLRNDMGVNKVAEFVLDFSQGHIYKVPAIELNDAAADNDNIFTVTIPDKKFSKFYMLYCSENTSLAIERQKELFPTVSYTCPFCHSPIDYKLSKDKRYKKGGIACRPDDIKSKTPITVFSKHGIKLKHCMYCAKDLRADDNSVFKSNMARLLPPAFMEYDNFKIAFTGSTRAGKTTYISRFFGITGDTKVSMPMTMTINSMNMFGITIKAASIAKVEIKGGGQYCVTDTNWPDEQPQYVERSICLHPSHYPNSSPSGDLTSYPFIAEVNNRAYISFYDIAGEDAQHSTQIGNVANHELIGIFCIINGKTDVSGNNDVIQMLKNAKLDKRCPVAVIVTKFDIIEDEFASDCLCLRSDYFESAGRKYIGAPIEWEIDYSSEEIKSYLQSKALLPDFTGVFDNVKYFGVSSFNFMDSIHEKDVDINSPGEVKFECSAKRMELPFLWMLKQFGLIN